MNKTKKVPEISIIIPASNAEKTIEKCVRSIFCNNNSFIQCIVVVNCTSDNTLKICETLKNEYNGLICINSQAKGVSQARNEALNVASGYIIGFCDADDYYEPHSIDIILEKINHYSIDILITGYYRTSIDENKEVKEKPPIIFHDKVISTSQAQGMILNHRCIMGSVWNKFYRKDLLAEIRFDEQLTHCEDTHFNMQILKKDNLKIMLIDIISYNYICNPLGATNSVEKCYTMDDKLKYLIAIEKIQNEYKGNKHIKKETSYAIASLSIDNYSSNLSLERKRKLRKSILQYMPYLFYGFFKYGIKKNAKRFLKASLIITHFI